MNIFATSPDPVRSARSLDDQRLIKMILESCQILATALDMHGLRRDGMCYPSHPHHPCIRWAAEYRDNWLWLWEHAIALDTERQRRYAHDRPHKTLSIMLDLKAHRLGRRLPSGTSTHANCAANKFYGLDFRHITDVHLAYRKYLAARWLLQSRPAQCAVHYIQEK